MALVCIPKALTDLLTPILPYLASTYVECQMCHLCQKCQNAIFDAYAIRHMSNIDMAILGQKDESGPQEYKPMPSNNF